MSSFKRLTKTITDQSASNHVPNRPLSRRSMLRSALGISIAGLGMAQLSACGFQPMYGNPSSPGSAGAATSARLALVQINPIADRIGQQMNNLLRDRMNPAGQPDKPSYHLAVTLTELSVTIASGNANTRHNDLTVTATYWLSHAESDSGYMMNAVTSQINVSYDTLDDPYNDLVTRQDAENRAVEQLADMITTRVGAYLARSGV